MVWAFILTAVLCPVFIWFGVDGINQSLRREQEIPQHKRWLLWLGLADFIVFLVLAVILIFQ